MIPMGNDLESLSPLFMILMATPFYKIEDSEIILNLELEGALKVRDDRTTRSQA